VDDRNPVNLRCSALLLRDDAVLLCRRTAEQNTWILPGGTPHRGEGSAATARREVAEETGLHIDAERVAFVLETTSWDADHHLIEIVFVGADRDPRAEPIQLEEGLSPSFVALDDLAQLGLRPPIAGYIRGFARAQAMDGNQTRATAAYLGNLWRPDEDVDSGVAPSATGD
jgi:8-oxo-dGTP diphosphatase